MAEINLSLRVVDLPAIGNLGHERVFEARGETSATAATQTRLFDFVDDPVRAHGEDVLGLMPVAAFHGAVNPGALILVQVGENAVLVRQTAVHAHGHGRHHHGCR